MVRCSMFMTIQKWFTIFWNLLYCIQKNIFFSFKQILILKIIINKVFETVIYTVIIFFVLIFKNVNKSEVFIKLSIKKKPNEAVKYYLQSTAFWMYLLYGLKVILYLAVFYSTIRMIKSIENGHRSKAVLKYHNGYTYFKLEKRIH